MDYKILILRRVILPVMLACSLFYSRSVMAAETIVLKYLFFQDEIAVRDLTELAETGQVSPSLQTYIDAGKQDPEQVRRILTREVKVSSSLLDDVLNSPVGEVLLDQIGQVIHTPSGRADRQALRAAIVLSAVGDDRISLLEILRNYPTSEIHVEGDRLIEAYTRLSRLEKVVQSVEELLQVL